MITQITDRERELSDVLSRSMKYVNELEAENARLKAELGDLPEAQAEMLTTIKRLKEAARQALYALIEASGHVNNDVFVKVMMAQDAVNDALKEALGDSHD